MADAPSSNDSLDPGAPPAPAPVPATPSRDPVAVAVACVALTAFGALIIYLLPRVGMKDPDWTRAVYLLTAVEAIAFAAAGFIFGREVNRARAESAEMRAELREDEATTGRALAKVVEASMAPVPRGPSTSETFPEAPPSTESASRAAMHNLAQDLLYGRRRR